MITPCLRCFWIEKEIEGEQKSAAGWWHKEKGVETRTLQTNEPPFSFMINLNRNSDFTVRTFHYEGP